MPARSPSILIGSILGLALSGPASAFADDTASSTTPKAVPARPLDAEVTSSTAAQFYDVRSPTGQTIIPRRRLMTTLGVAVYDLLDRPTDPKGPQLTFRARMRYDADYGGNADETNVGRFDAVVPGFSRGPIDLMYGYVEGRRFLDGYLGFKLGRQYVIDALGWWSFDGGQVKVTTPYYFAVEGYGGFEQRGGMPLSTPRYERDGVWRGDRTGYDPNLWPSFQPNDLAPAFGVALESAGFTWLHGRATYRRVYSTGASNVTPFASGLRAPETYDGSRISQERLGYAFDGTLASLGGVKGGIVYDVYVGKVSNMYASIDGYVSKRVTVGLDYEYYVPTFDGDSIWNFFLAMPMNDLSVRGEWNATDHVAVSGGLRGRVFSVQTKPEGVPDTAPNGLSSADYYPSSGVQPMGGGNLAARYRFGEGSAGARGSADVANNGDRVGIDFFAQRTLETRYLLSGRAGVWQWNDELRPDRSAASVGYVAGVGYNLFPRSQVLTEFEHDMNRLAGQRFRVMIWLNIALSSR